jgi:hypothetical protein
MEDATNKPNHVTVTVDPSGTVGCDPNPLPTDGRNVILKFVLITEGYVFPKEGAVVVTDPGTEFPEPSKTLPPNDTKATLFDRNTGPGDFRYTVTVQKVATGELLRHDPMIENGP